MRIRRENNEEEYRENLEKSEEKRQKPSRMVGFLELLGLDPFG
jgi:hypothetical protein